MCCKGLPVYLVCYIRSGVSVLSRFLQPGKVQDSSIHHAAIRAERSPAAAMQQQVVLHQAAKKDTEELYGAFLDAARETAAAESK